MQLRPILRAVAGAVGVVGGVATIYVTVWFVREIVMPIPSPHA